ncbi:MAG: TerB family tellurite resistance protein [Polyangia bacterium]
MSWLGKIIGGAIGFAAGGPVGAAIGVGVGHGVDSLAGRGGGSGKTGVGSSQGPDEIDVEASYQKDETGLAFGLAVKEPVPDGALGVIRVVDGSGRILGGRAPFVSEHGEFFVSAPVVDGICRVYVPLGAVRYDKAGAFAMVFEVVVLNDGGVPKPIGGSVFQLDFPSPIPWSKVAWLSPLIGLCMEVVRADGRMMPDEVRLVRRYFEEVFELDSEQVRELKREMKKTAAVDLETLVTDAMRRLSTLDPLEILAILADIAKCDGEAHPSEVDLIRKVAMAMGADSRTWEQMAAELGLGGDRREASGTAGSGMSLARAYEILGLEQSASTAEVQAAYRKLVSEYHPDRVASLPKEFQDVAHLKMTEINAAYGKIRGRLTRH